MWVGGRLGVEINLVNNWCMGKNKPFSTGEQHGWLGVQEWRGEQGEMGWPVQAMLTELSLDPQGTEVAQKLHELGALWSHLFFRSSTLLAAWKMNLKR